MLVVYPKMKFGGKQQMVQHPASTLQHYYFITNQLQEHLHYLE